MYRDKSLVPGEAMRLAALGLLMEQSQPYGTLATEIRFITGRLIGPSLDMLGSSLELLKLEGLVLGQVAKDAAPGQELLQISDSGRSDFLGLMQAPIRMPLNDINRVALFLKMRFLPLLPDDQALDVIDHLIENFQQQLARLSDLQQRQQQPLLQQWMELEITAIRQQIAWLEAQMDARSAA